MELSETLTKIFPLTQAHFQSQCADSWPRFLAELEITDERKASVYWPLYLRKQGAPLSMVEVAHYESLCRQATEFAEACWGTNKLAEVSLNPTAQVIPIERSAEILGCERGVYAIFMVGPQLQRKALTLAQAMCFEQIQEDRVFTKAQFVEWMKMEFAEAGLNEDSTVVINDLIKMGLLQVNQIDFVD